MFSFFRLTYLLTFSFFSSIFLLQAEPTGSSLIESKVLNMAQSISKSIFLLEDETLWEGANPPFQSQTWSEWLTGKPHTQPDNRFYFLLSEWEMPVCIRLYPIQKEDNSAFSYPYLMENVQTGHCVYVRPIQGAELFSVLMRYGQDQYDKGYMQGQAGDTYIDPAPDF